MSNQKDYEELIKGTTPISPPNEAEEGDNLQEGTTPQPPPPTSSGNEDED
ncbi:MAG: hypothetical protein OXI17_14670 [Gammaproteobacteria bacterium]|nr:hypothetical protein [Gammaproteobacteria bacterium]